MKNKKQILKLFSNWGKSQQVQFKDRQNTKLKIATLVGDSITNERKTKIKKPIRSVKLGFALGMAVVALFLVTNWLFSPIIPTSNFKQYVQNLIGNNSTKITASNLGIKYSSGVGSGSRNKNSLSKTVDTVDKVLDGQPATVSVIDTREYLKYYYSADIKTRHVELIANRVQTIIRGYGGRMDNASVNNKNAYLSFVVPKKSFELFKNEIKSLVGNKFITVSFNSQNLLSQKINIEDKTKTTSSSLDSYKAQKNNLTDQHNKTIANYTSYLNYYSNQVWNLQQELKNTTSTVAQSKLNKKIANDNYQWSYYKKLVNKENVNYNSQLKSLNSKIASLQNQLTNLNKQDVNLTNNVETVEGYISIRWISIGQIIALYLSFYWWLIVLVVIILIIFIFYSRRNSLPVV